MESSTTAASAKDQSQKTITVDSIPYHTVSEGPDGPLVVLIHALMANHHIYDHTVQTLHQAGYRTLRYDHVGHNLTPPPTDPTRNKPGAFHFNDMCRHLNIIISTLFPNTTPAAIIGCSIGGVLALRYHMLYPPPNGTTTKIISMAAPGLSTLPDSPEKWHARIAKWKADGTVTELATQTIARWFPDPAPPQARDIVESCTLDGYEICAWATMNFDFTPELSMIEDGRNIMILAGLQDGNIGPREVLVAVSRATKGSKYVLLDGVGHIPPMHPELFEPVLMEFLGEAKG